MRSRAQVLERPKKTISSSSVPTEREFPILQFTKRKERFQLSVQHLSLLTRILHNSPELLDDEEADSVHERMVQVSSLQKCKRRTPDEPCNRVLHDDEDEISSDEY
ncbi:hypothetical protein BLNAU_16580 [Blattamonas nauphoetae]|uniref:Uncharacterized protein n=1 Tax=Blattamonas nauphoetae TaxID=2049346 RepID=A0ABQ9X9A5_9EUKA|nr:hypothetical protein BLNAU_16580 [Blattamonas nauphoetae]